MVTEGHECRILDFLPFGGAHYNPFIGVSSFRYLELHFDTVHRSNLLERRASVYALPVPDTVKSPFGALPSLMDPPGSVLVFFGDVGPMPVDRSPTKPTPKHGILPIFSSAGQAVRSLWGLMNDGLTRRIVRQKNGLPKVSTPQANELQILTSLAAPEFFDCLKIAFLGDLRTGHIPGIDTERQGNNAYGWVMSTPNSSRMPFPILLPDYPLCMHADSKFGPVDPTKHPQVGYSSAAYTSVIPRPPSDRSGKYSHIPFWSDTVEEFLYQDPQTIALRQVLATPTTSPVFSFAHDIIAKAQIVVDSLQSLANRFNTTYGHLEIDTVYKTGKALVSLTRTQVDRMRTLELVREDSQHQVSVFQRAALEARAFFEYWCLFYETRGLSTPLPVNDDYLGMFALTDASAKYALFAGIPVWLIRPTFALQSSHRIVEFTKIESLPPSLRTEPSWFQPRFTGPTHSIRFRSHTSSFAAVRFLAYGTSFKHLHQTTPDSQTSALSTAPTNLETNPFSFRSTLAMPVAPEIISLFKDDRDDFGFIPSAVAVWQSMRASYTPTRHDSHFQVTAAESWLVNDGSLFPPIGLFSRIKQRNTFLANLKAWIYLRKSWMTLGMSGAPIRPKKAEWKGTLFAILTALQLKDDDQPSTSKRRKAHTSIPDADRTPHHAPPRNRRKKENVGKVLETLDLDIEQGSTQELQFTIHGQTVGLREKIPDFIYRYLLFEMEEVNFRRSVLQLDQTLAKSFWESSSATQVTLPDGQIAILTAEEAYEHRVQEIRSLWGGDDFLFVDPFASRQGLSALDWETRRLFVVKFHGLMKEWQCSNPSILQALRAASFVYGNEQSFLSFEKIIIHSYVRVFWSVFNAPPPIIREVPTFPAAT
ncbi:hypothetical protein DL96DRAFT_1566031 [Flagelloscypha sp. PMI_526]|nr:hypothetical protein DL96DRAFT_1566031 [Flagelloscypha sp. PMI_526]